LTFALLFPIAACRSGGPSSSTVLTSIFAPETTPAKSIVDLAMFVLVITGLIFVVVFSC
jgi:hypothetical protein